ncbi:MAG: hypothetical protein AB7L71_20010 [Vicinamibacterales bacterium]
MKRVWMRFADHLHIVMTTVLFGAVYLLVVPVFALVARLTDAGGWRPRGTPPSTWRPKTPITHDRSFFDRLW